MKIHASIGLKKLISVAVLLVCTQALALTQTVNGIRWTYTISGGKASVGGGTSSDTAVSTTIKGAITIPSSLGGCPVTGIGPYAFCQCYDLTGVAIPDGVTSIGSHAFHGCVGLGSMAIPDGVTSIGSSAFAYCSSLRSVTIPKSVTSIDGGAFGHCSSLAVVTMAGNPPSVDSPCFNGVASGCIVKVNRILSEWWNIYITSYNEWEGMRIVFFCTHDVVAWIYNERKATCTEAGYTGDLICSACEKLIKNGTTIPALGHNMGAGVVTKEPTLLDTGVMSYCCTRCKILLKTELIPKLDILQVLCDCLGGLPYGSVTLGSDEVQWRSDSETTHNGSCSLRLMGNGDDSESSVRFVVRGDGQLSFWWKVSSEYDSEDDSVYDYAYLKVDGVDQGGLTDDYKLFGHAIGGSTDWTNVVIDVTGTGNHTIAWTYKKDEVDEIAGFEDCVWLENVVWRPMVSVSFALGGAVGSVPDPVAALSGTAITLPAAEGFSREGYIFAGWSVGDNLYADGDSYVFGDSNIVFTAIWTRTTILTFALGGGTGALPTSIHEVPGSVVSLPDSNGIERDGYVFAGWSDGAKTYAAGELYTLGNSDVVLTAIWIRESTLKFALNGGTGDAPAAIQVVPGTIVVLPSASGFNKPKHAFAGWSDGSKTYAENANYTVTDSDVEFAALWTAKTISKPTIQSPNVANGGVVTNAASVTLTLLADEGATLHYTLDGSTPTAESSIYTKPMELTDYAVKIKVIAIRNDYFDSDVAEFSFTRKPYTLAECLGLEGVSDAIVSTGGDGEAWHRVLGDESHDGTAGLRSGAITHNQTNWVEVCVNGSGTLFFWWKASSEVVRGKVRDGASFFVDGELKSGPIGGADGGWMLVSYEVAGEGQHTFRWEFGKSATDSADIGEDCAWLDDVTWIVPCEVSNVIAKQRYPWNGLVDISCNVSGIVGTATGYKFNVAVTIADSGEVRNLSQVWVVQDGKTTTDLEVRTNGDHRLLWDARADLGEVLYSNMVVHVKITVIVYAVMYTPGVNGIGVQQTADKTHGVALMLSGAMFTRNGYTQTGWATSDGGAKAYDLGATYAENAAVTLYPYWTPNIYTVTYNPGANASGTPQTAYKTHDIALTLKGALFTRNGYTQTGWATSDGGAKTYELDATYTANTAAMLYPYWTPNTYTVTYNPGANGSGAPQTADKIHDVALALNGAMFTRSGYMQIGWATSDGGVKVYGLGVSYTANEALTLYPFWTKSHDKVQLWANGPYWATTNIGAEEPWEYGYYFWWGDTIGYKRENNAWVASYGSSSSFRFSNNNPITLQTYERSDDTLRSEGWITANNVLAPEHDAAQVQWGGSWRMPTPDELNNLNNNCNWTWSVLNGVNGYIVSGRGAYSSNSIFLPACGTGDGTILVSAGFEGRYWSSAPSPTYWGYAYVLIFGSSTHRMEDGGPRFYGRSIRPVQGYVSADVYAITYNPGANGSGTQQTVYKTHDVALTLNGATFTRNGYMQTGWATSDGGAKAYDLGVSYTANKAITLYPFWTKSHDKVQLWANGPYWATTNIGAESPEDYGYYFWWGDTVGYRREDDVWVASNGSASNYEFYGNSSTHDKSISTLRSEGVITDDGVLAPSYDAAHVHWGGAWRMPTKDEISDLNSDCDWAWTTKNGVRGYIVRGRGSYASASIFLPCAGYGYGASFRAPGSFGCYWSSQCTDSEFYAFRYYFFSGGHYTDGDGRWLGQSVRPVQDSAE